MRSWAPLPLGHPSRRAGARLARRARHAVRGCSRAPKVLAQARGLALQPYRARLPEHRASQHNNARDALWSLLSACVSLSVALGDRVAREDITDRRFEVFVHHVRRVFIFVHRRCVCEEGGSALERLTDR